jgi:hypothetical protein
MVRVEYIRNIDRLIIRDTNCSILNPKRSVLGELDRYATRSSINRPRLVYEISPEQTVLIEWALHTLYTEAPNLEVPNSELSAIISKNYSPYISTAHKVVGDLRIYKHASFMVDGTKVNITIGENGRDSKKLTRFEYISDKVTTVVRVKNRDGYIIQPDNVLTFITDPFNLSFSVFTPGPMPLRTNSLRNIEISQNGRFIGLNTRDMWRALSFIGNILTYAARGITYEAFVALG